MTSLARYLVYVFFFGILIYSCQGTSPLDDARPACADAADPDTLQLPASQMKGWELYAWPGCGDWNYSILYGTNALKTYDEVTALQPGGRQLIKVWGLANIKKALAKIPAGQSVSLVGAAWLERVWGAGSYGNLMLPPTAVVNELRNVATQAGVDFHVLD